MSENIGVYKAQQQGHGHPLTIIMSKKTRKEEKSHGEISSLKKEQGTKFEILCLQHIFIFS